MGKQWAEINSPNKGFTSADLSLDEIQDTTVQQTHRESYIGTLEALQKRALCSQRVDFVKMPKHATMIERLQQKSQENVFW